MIRENPDAALPGQLRETIEAAFTKLLSPDIAPNLSPAESSALVQVATDALHHTMTKNKLSFQDALLSPDFFMPVFTHIGKTEHSEVAQQEMGGAIASLAALAIEETNKASLDRATRRKFLAGGIAAGVTAVSFVTTLLTPRRERGRTDTGNRIMDRLISHNDDPPRLQVESSAELLMDRWTRASVFWFSRDPRNRNVGLRIKPPQATGLSMHIPLSRGYSLVRVSSDGQRLFVRLRHRPQYPEGTTKKEVLMEISEAQDDNNALIGLNVSMRQEPLHDRKQQK